MRKDIIAKCIDNAFARCNLTKTGKKRVVASSPKALVEMCIKHLKTRSDPIISPYFVSLCDVDGLFELDAVSHEMQRHRMSIGVFYQYLLLELMRQKWHVFDGSREGDIIADIETPTFESGLRLYMSVKKSKDTVGGQDVPGVISRLDSLAKEEKNLTRPYLCVICIATPSNGKLLSYSDRHIRCDKKGNPYSLNCEHWGPGFIFPYITGRDAREIYLQGINRVAEHLPFFSLTHRQECSALLKNRLNELGLLTESGKLSPEKFLAFCCSEGRK
ncbi:MAG: hypothetical protein Q7T18_01785, partial [Sedimentisphaerales bacterium]|nr:hypothetical protein [Sedimentisphaerales bacterium]